MIHDRLPQGRDADARGVLVLAAPDRGDGGLEHLGRPVGVRETLAEVHGSVLKGERRHLREDPISRRIPALRAQLPRPGVSAIQK